MPGYSRTTSWIPVSLAVLLLLPTPASTQESSEAAPATLELTLNQAYALALDANEEDRIRAADLAIAEARYRQAIGSFFPSIGLFAEKAWQDRIDRNDEEELGRSILQEVNPEAAGLLPESDTPTGTNANPFVGGVSLSWPIFSGFRSYNESRSYDLDRTSARYQRERFRELLFLDLADVFYQVLLYEESLALLEKEAQALTRRRNEIAGRVRLGRSRQGELLEAQSDLQSNLVERENVRGLLRVSRELLAFVVSVPADNFALTDSQDVPESPELEHYLDSVGERKDIMAAISEMRAARSRVQEEESRHYPSIALEGEYYLAQRPDSGRDWRVTLRIDLPLFEGGSSSAYVAEQEALHAQSELALERLRRTASYEVRSAYHEFVSAAARTVLLEESVRLANLTYAVQGRDYRLGIVTNLEALQALARVHDSERSLLEAKMQMRLAHIRLHIAAGRMPTE